MKSWLRATSLAIGATALLAGGAATFRHEFRREAARMAAPQAPPGPLSCTSGDACAAHAGAAAAHPVAPALAELPGDRARLLVFSSQYCGACARMAPVVKAAEVACASDRDVIHVDFDDERGEALAAKYGITLLPSFVSIEANGREVSRLTGVQSQAVIERVLEEVRGTRCAAADAPERGKAM